MNVTVSCMGWVPICWRELLGLFSMNTKAVEDTLLDLTVADKPAGLPDLPNSVIENVLSRLSPMCILQCQRDSKALQVLTKTPYFTRMQHNRSSPVIILQSIPGSVCHGDVELYFSDVESRNVDKKIVEIDSCYRQKRDPILLLGSHDGFLLFANRYKNPPVFYVWNPITDQKATFSPLHSHFHVCGFYFCYLRREFVLLFVSKKGAPFEFKIYNFGTKSREKVGYFPYPPSCDRPPIIVKKTLYWMVDQNSFKDATGEYPTHSHSVVSFQFETKKFGTIGHDGLLGMSVIDRSQVHLLKLDEELCICDSIGLTKIELSVLNHETKCWVKKHTVILPNGDYHFFKLSLRTIGKWENKLFMEVLPYKKGELLVRQKKRLFIYNLYTHTCRPAEVKGLEFCNVQSIVHIDSLASF